MPARQYGAPVDPRENSRGGRGRSAAGGESSQSYGQQNRSAAEPPTKKEDPSPTGRIVEAFHKNADTDTRRESIHHTLGPQASQASPGDHTHDGGSSKALLEGFILTGNKSNPITMWPSILNALKELGAKDQTT